MKILLATDGSAEATAASRFLQQLPIAPGAAIRIVSVADDYVLGEEYLRRTTNEWLFERAQQAAETAVRNAAALLEREGLSLTTAVLSGNPAQEILRAAEAAPTDLVVVGSRGLSGLTRFFLGSVAERVARHASCPVLLGRPLVNDLRQAVVGIDGSDSAVRAVDWLRQFPLPDQCQVHFVTLMPFLEGLSPSRKLQWPARYRALYEEQAEAAQQHLEAVAASWLAGGRQGAAALRPGDPADGLLRYADEQQADLIVMGSRGVGAIERFLLGSTSEKVLRHSEASALIVR